MRKDMKRIDKREKQRKNLFSEVEPAITKMTNLVVFAEIVIESIIIYV